MCSSRGIFGGYSVYSDGTIFDLAVFGFVHDYVRKLVQYFCIVVKYEPERKIIENTFNIEMKNRLIFSKCTVIFSNEHDFW